MEMSNEINIIFLSYNSILSAAHGWRINWKFIDLLFKKYISQGNGFH